VAFDERVDRLCVNETNSALCTLSCDLTHIDRILPLQRTQYLRVGFDNRQFEFDAAAVAPLGGLLGLADCLPVPPRKIPGAPGEILRG
jgi:hypothetical protein